MKTGLLIALASLALLAASPTATAQAKKAPGSAKAGTRHRFSLLEVEKVILNKLNLNSGQKRETERLMATMENQSAAVRGKGLVPHDRRADAAKLEKIGADYRNGIKKVLTADQFAKYQKMHANVAYKLRQIAEHPPRRGGVHF